MWDETVTVEMSLISQGQYKLYCVSVVVVQPWPDGTFTQRCVFGADNITESLFFCVTCGRFEPLLLCLVSSSVLEVLLQARSCILLRWLERFLLVFSILLLQDETLRADWLFPLQTSTVVCFFFFFWVGEIFLEARQQRTNNISDTYVTLSLW